jgi:thioesterase domain-containing protein
MTNLLELTSTIHQNIPLSRHLAFQLQERVGDRLVLTANLAPNKNDKGTMFAGSISTLCTLAGWTLTGQMAADLGFVTDVLAVKNDIAFLLPIRTDASFRAVADPELLPTFNERMKRRGRARMRVQVEVVAGEDVCARFQGDYLAQIFV